MIPCKFFQLGKCKYGSNCRFQHIGPGASENYGGNYQQSNAYNSRNSQPSYGFSSNNRFGALSDSQTDKYVWKSPSSSSTTEAADKNISFNDFVTSVCTDVDAAQKGKQWIFSCFGPGGQSGGNYADLDDTSQEELRWEAYQCREQGNMQNYIQGVEQLQRKHDAINREILSRSTKVMDLLGQLFSTQSQNSAAPSSQTSSFGNASSGATPSSFSFSLSHLNPNPPPTFPAAAAVASPFGQASNQFTQNNSWPASQPFGSSSLQTGFNQVQTQNASIFGGGTGNTSFTNPAYEAPKPAPSIFGGSGSALGSSVSAPVSASLGGTSAFNQGSPSVQTAKGSEKPTNTNETYTPLDQLTQEEQEQFMAANFTIGRIPIRPPPKELCF